MRRTASAAEREADPRHERAQVLVETAIAFPVQMMITLAIMQFCLIAGAKQVVNYAAHAACRALLVGENPHMAASIVCSPIAGTTRPAGSAEPIYIPGRGTLPRSVQSQLKTSYLVLNDLDDGDGPGDKKVTVSVTHRYELIIPFVSYTAFATWHPLWGTVEKIGSRNSVHKVLTQTMTLPHMWDDDLEGVVGHDIIPDLSPQDP
jgi:Flp pilus assembly protein TadG